MIDFGNSSECDLFKLTRQQFKDRYLKTFLDEVVYVDLEKNSSHIYLRCKSPQATKSLLSNSEFLTQFRKELLVNEEEMEYFKKIYQNRNKKMEKKDKKGKNKKVNFKLKIPRVILRAQKTQNRNFSRRLNSGLIYRFLPLL